MLPVASFFFFSFSFYEQLKSSQWHSSNMCKWNILNVKHMCITSFSHFFAILMQQAQRQEWFIIVNPFLWEQNL